MKSNKGFTLIELLAVIVILAIIALIATPTILGVIETARTSSAQSSVLGYVDAVEKQIAIDALDLNTTDVITVADDNTITIGTGDTGLTIKGTKPTAGTLTYDSTKGAITAGTNIALKIGGKDYCVQYDGTKATATEGACSAGSEG